MVFGCCDSVLFTLVAIKSFLKGDIYLTKITKSLALNPSAKMSACR